MEKFDKIKAGYEICEALHHNVYRWNVYDSNNEYVGRTSQDAYLIDVIQKGVLPIQFEIFLEQGNSVFEESKFQKIFVYSEESKRACLDYIQDPHCYGVLGEKVDPEFLVYEYEFLLKTKDSNMINNITILANELKVTWNVDKEGILLKCDDYKLDRLMGLLPPDEDANLEVVNLNEVEGDDEDLFVDDFSLPKLI